MIGKRFASLPLAVLLGVATGSAAIGCSKEVKVEAPPPPPPPPPPADGDGDGIPDTEDKCVAEAEDGNPPDAKDGCPNKDLDGDGILIPTDRCADQKEVVNGFEDADGCPDEKPIVQLQEEDIQINQQILFENDSKEIQEASQVVIDAVAKVMVEHPEVELVQVGGHASVTGNSFYNRTLTQSRVDSVSKALQAKGVDKSRLLTQGYGFYCPIAEGDTEEASAKNRRVEFKILINKGKKTGVQLGCDAAKAKGIRPPTVPEPKLAPPAEAVVPAVPEEREPMSAPAAAPATAPAAPAAAPVAPAPAAAAPKRPVVVPAPAPAPAPAPVAPAPAPTPAPPSGGDLK